MIKSATFDPSKRLDLYFRINRDGSKRFIFFDTNGNEFDITGISFELLIRDYPGAKPKVISMTSGAGLEIPVYEINILDVSVTADQTLLNEGEFYWELYLINEKRTWLSGKAFFHNGEFDGVENDTESLTIIQNGETIQITVQGSVGSGVEHFRGAYDLSATNDYPTTGGNGLGGAPAEGDYWFVAVPGTLDVYGLGIISVYYGALIIYLGGDVSDPQSWRVIQ